MLRLSLLIVTVSLFVLNYPICEFFYPGNDYVSIRVWNYINIANLHTLFFLGLVNIKLLSNSNGEFYRFILAVGLGITASDLIDRWFLHITQFVLSDWIMISVVVLIEYKNNLHNYVRQRRRSS